MFQGMPNTVVDFDTTGRTSVVVRTAMASTTTIPTILPDAVITRESVVQLHVWANKLRLHSLQIATTRFYEQDLSIRNCYYYYEQAHVLHAPDILDAVLQVVIGNLSKITVRSDVMCNFRALSLWKRVTQSTHRVYSQREGIQLSTLLACFCKLHRRRITKTDFRYLTNVRHMPILHYQVAITLLEMSKEVQISDVDDTSTTTTNTACTSLNHLQIRCLKSIAKASRVRIKEANFQEILSKLNVVELQYLLNLASRHGGSVSHTPPGTGDSRKCRSTC
jgi:hypothetical protein